MSTAAPKSLIDLLEVSVARQGPRALFLTKNEGRWVETSYAAFAGMVEAARSGLAGLGVRPGDRVGIISANCIEWAAVAYASYGLGAAVVPMYESQREGDWAFVLRDAAVGVLFVGNATIRDRVSAFAATIPTLRTICLLDDPSWRRSGDAGVPRYRPDGSDVAALLYTSGTTGEPKGVILTHGNIVSNITTVLALIPMSERHRTLSFLPWAHAFGHTLELHGVIAAGASMAIAEGVDKLVDNLAEVRPTVLVAVPRVFLRVYSGVTTLLAAKPRPLRWLAQRGLALARLRTAGQHLSWLQSLLWKVADQLVFAKVRRRVGGRLQFAISGAAGLPKVVAEMVDGLGIQLYEGYGLTEASPIVSANVPGHRKLGSVGRPIPGVRVEIDTTTTGDVRQGEVVVYGPNVMRGYHGADASHAGVTESGALRTGDLGYLDEDGYLYITGRLKEQYKLTNGRYVSPAVLEERLKLSPHIADVMIYGENREYNVALVVPDLEAARALVAGAVGAAPCDVNTLLRMPSLRERIAADIESLSQEFRRFEKISGFALLPEGFTQGNGMLTPSLKLKRREIVARWGAEIERLYAPSN